MQREMFERINNYLNESFEIQTSKTAEKILKSVNKAIQDQDGSFKFKPVEITDNEIMIKVTPSSLAPFLGVGTVKLTLPRNSGSTIINCDIYPFNNSYKYILMIGTSLMTLWTLTSILISTDKNSLLVLGMAWTGAIVVNYISVLMNKKRLINYSKTIIEELLK